MSGRMIRPGLTLAISLWFDPAHAAAGTHAEARARRRAREKCQRLARVIVQHTGFPKLDAAHRAQPTGHGSGTSNASMRLPCGTYSITGNVPMLECLHLSQVDDGPEV